MRFRSLRGATLVGALLLACSSDDDDRGCAIGEKACATNADCEGFAPPDFTILGPPIDARCFHTECVAEKCKATPIAGRVEDDTDGDCSKSACNEEGRLERSPDPSDPPPSRAGLGPCERSVCEQGLFGGLGPVTRSLPEGATCFSGTEEGTCSAGRCVTELDDGAADASTDAATDSDADASDDGSIDAPADAATD